MDAFLSRDASRFLAQTEKKVFLRIVESFLYRDVTRFLAKTEYLFSEEIWIHLYIEMIPHYLRKQLFSLDQKSGCISNSPKHDPCLKDACIFFEDLKWPTLNVKKTGSLHELTDHYKRYNWAWAYRL